MSLLKARIKKLFRIHGKGSVSFDWRVLDPISPAQYQFIVEQRIPTVVVTVKNDWSEPVTDIRIQVRLQGVSDWIRIFAQGD